jgi:hypothetical protein
MTTIRPHFRSRVYILGDAASTVAPEQEEEVSPPTQLDEPDEPLVFAPFFTSYRILGSEIRHTRLTTQQPTHRKEPT